MVTQLTHIKLKANKNKTVCVHLYCEKQYKITYIYAVYNGTIKYSNLLKNPSVTFLHTHYNNVKKFLYNFDLYQIKSKKYKLRLTYCLDLIIDYTKNKWQIVHYNDSEVIYESTQMRDVIIFMNLLVNYYEQVG